MIDIFDIRLRNALREDLGSTYGVDIGHSTSREPVPSYQIGISFGADPARLDSLTRIVFQQIDSLQTHGVTPEEIAKAKEAQRRDWETNTKRNGYWLGQIAARDLNKERIADFLILPERLNNISAKQVQAAALLLRRDNYVRVSLVPER
jgi:zinc protease